MKTKIFFLLICLTFSSRISSQSYFGIRAEPFAYLATVEKITSGPAGSKTNELSFESNLTFTLSLTFKGTDNLSISLRTGIIPGNLYGGIEGGFYWIYDFTKDKYLIIGINTHLNVGLEGSHNGGSSKAVTIPFLAIGGGYKISEHCSAELQFNHSLNNIQYGYKRKFQSIQPYSITYYYKIPWLIKLSLSYEWEF